MEGRGIAMTTATILKCNFSPIAVMPSCRRIIAVRPDFGIKFFNAGNLQVGLGMVEDLFDAVHWVVDQGVADPKRIAAMGGSMGGYATLRALEMRPDLFAAAWMNLGPPMKRRAFDSFPVTGPTYRRVGAAAREMPIMTRNGIEKSRLFIMSTKFERRFSLLREKTIRG